MCCDLKEGAREAVCIAIQPGRGAGTRRRACGVRRAGAQSRRSGQRARLTGAGRAAGARGLGVLLGCGLCPWCTQPVFDPV